MAATPRLKIYNPQGEYIASCKHGEDAAMIVSGYGDGAKIKDRYGKVLWHEGYEDQPAGDSYDHVAERCAGAY